MASVVAFAAALASLHFLTAWSSKAAASALGAGHRGEPEQDRVRASQGVQDLVQFVVQSLLQRPADG